MPQIVSYEDDVISQLDLVLSDAVRYGLSHLELPVADFFQG